MSRAFASLLGAALLAAGVPGPAQESRTAARVSVTELSQGRILPTADDESFVLSPDGRRLAYVAERGKKKVVVVNDQLGKEYDDVLPGSVLFSPNSRHVAYLAREGAQFRRVLDSREGPSYDAMANLIFSPDSAHTAYAAARREVGWRVVVDGEEGKFYQSLQSGFRFTPDSQRVVYSAQRPKKGHFNVTPQLTSGDGDRLQNARAHRREQLVQKGGWRLVVGEKEHDAYERVGGPALSDAGERLAYFGLQNTGKWALVLDGKETRTYDGYLEDGIAFSPNGRRLAYGVRQGSRWSVIIDGKPSAEYDDLSEETPFFSPDGKRVAFVGKRGGKSYLVEDGAEREFDSLVQGSWLFSPDGLRLACVAKKGEQLFVPVEGKDGTGIEKAVTVQRPVFSPDSRNLAYAARSEGGWRLVLNGVEADSRTYAGVPQESRPVWDSATHFHLLMLRDRELLLVEAELLGGTG